MIENLTAIDRELFIRINDLNNSFFDIVMFWVSHKYFWIWFYLILVFFIIRYYKYKTIIIFFFIVLTIFLSDQISVHLFKNMFERLRPCHDPDLAGQVHLIRGHCGGMYGFVSSHAANSFALFGLLSMLFKDHNKLLVFILLFWAFLVSYSRVYAGVHYPADVFFGALLGLFIGWGVYKLLITILNRFVQN